MIEHGTDEHVALCAGYAYTCLKSNGNHQFTDEDRYFATMGEVDWLVAKRDSERERYQKFLKSKRVFAESVGFQVEPERINPRLFEWQCAVVGWALRKGRAALFEGCGLGKTAQQLEWGRQVWDHTGGNVLILAPLAVAEQTAHEEAPKFDIPITLCRSQADVRAGINITNYEMLQHFDVAAFEGVVLDESSILKTHDGKTRQAITDAFAATPYRLACTATPSPNDYMELGTHAEFLGVMKRSEMLSMFFVHDSGDTSKWRLKGHAEQEFWKWVCSWAVVIQKPSDIGFSDDGYILPALHRIEHIVEFDTSTMGLNPERLSLKQRRDVRRATISERVAKCAEIVNATDESFIIWCDLNAESEALTEAIEHSIQVTGSDTREFKIRIAHEFVAGNIKRVITKSSIWGYGLNLQCCHNEAFVGLSDSFEQIYQATRRCWRFGQTEDVNAHIITSTGDGAVVRNIQRKERDFEAMTEAMVDHMRAEMVCKLGRLSPPSSNPVERKTGAAWTAILGDCVEETMELMDNSVGLSLFSPPFSSLYTYSASNRDMGNSGSDREFADHLKFLIRELYRITIPGRMVAFHCMNIPAMKERDGYIGIKDFRGQLTRAFMDQGFIFHSEHVIWKDPLTEAVRTKSKGLMHKQLMKDSSASRAGLPDYLIAMRKPGENPIPVPHENGLESFAGDNPPANGTLSHERWRRYASPVWMDIRQGNTLQKQSARQDEDEKHICPLQLDVIERALELWSTKDDLIFSPFMGIGSEGFQAIKMGRRFLGIELKKSYWEQACQNLTNSEFDTNRQMRISFDSEDVDSIAI